MTPTVTVTREQIGKHTGYTARVMLGAAVIYSVTRATAAQAREDAEAWVKRALG